MVVVCGLLVSLRIFVMLLRVKRVFIFVVVVSLRMFRWCKVMETVKWFLFWFNLFIIFVAMVFVECGSLIDVVFFLGVCLIVNSYYRVINDH